VFLQANTAIAAAAAAVVDLYGELQALRGHLQHEQWRAELEQVLQRQLPKLTAWADLQVRTGGWHAQQSKVSSMWRHMMCAHELFCNGSQS
jgi:hypothetical protein